MILRIRKLLFLIIIAGGWQDPLFAQTSIQVVSRIINRDFTYTTGMLIFINGEKAQIKIRPSVTKQIKMVITLIAKNPSKQEAETDVKFCNYTINESAGRIAITNFFDTKKGYKEITSNLSARIEFEIPAELTCTIRNIYGTIDLRGVQAIWNITNDFGQLSFQNISGTLHINTKYGDISGTQINAITSIDAQKSDIKITGINKMLRIKNQYGSIELENVKAPLNIDGEMTEIKILGVDFNNVSCDFTTLKGNINVPKEYQSFIVNKPGEVNFKLTRGSNSMKVKTSYNNIILK